MRFVFSLIVVVLSTGSVSARIPQAPRLPQSPEVRYGTCGSTGCDCKKCGDYCSCIAGECGPGCVCGVSGAYWRKSPNDQYGLFVGDRQIGVWNGEGYYPIVDGQWGKKCKIPPVPLPKPEISRLPRPQTYIPPRVLGGELVPLHYSAPATYIQPMYQPQYQSFAPACVGGNCPGGR